MSPSSLPFAELQKQATLGESIIATAYPGRTCFISSMESGNKIAHVYGHSALDGNDAASAELIARLLNFAQAGGVEAMQNVLKSAEWTLQVMPEIPANSEFRSSVSDARAALAILEGKA